MALKEDYLIKRRTVVVIFLGSSGYIKVLRFYSAKTQLKHNQELAIWKALLMDPDTSLSF